MIEAGKNLPLVAKAAQDFVRIQAALDDLDGDRLAKLIVCARGQIDDTHPAAPKLAHQLVAAYALSFARFLRVVQEQAEGASELRLGEKVGRLAFGREQ